MGIKVSVESHHLSASGKESVSCLFKLLKTACLLLFITPFCSSSDQHRSTSLTVIFTSPSNQNEEKYSTLKDSESKIVIRLCSGG